MGLQPPFQLIPGDRLSTANTGRLTMDGVGAASRRESGRDGPPTSRAVATDPNADWLQWVISGNQ